MTFESREEAGKALAQELKKQEVELDLILAIPRGGVIIGKWIAKALRLPLDVTVTRKIGSPHNPEFAIAATALDETIILNPDARSALLPPDYLEKKKAEIAQEIRRRLKLYRGEEQERVVAGKRICLTDDGLATGLTVLCAVQSLRNRGASFIHIAAPVGSREAYRRLLKVADRVFFLSMPDPFMAVGQFYHDFHQVSDEEVLAALRESQLPFSATLENSS